MSLRHLIAWLLLSGMVGAIVAYVWYLTRDKRAFRRSRRRVNRRRAREAPGTDNSQVLFEPD